MATVYGSYMSTSGGKNFIRPYITYTITTTETNVKVVWSAGCNVKANWTTNAKITLKTTAPEASDRSRTVDDAGWSGGNHLMIPSSGTVEYNYSRGTSDTTKTLKAAMSTSVDSSSVSVSISVPARTSVTLTYNSNGGSSIGSDTFYYGIAKNISTTVPTRTNYTFLGWSSTDGGSVEYSPGTSLTLTANKTIYAVWKSAYTAPNVQGEPTAYRVANGASGKNPALLNTGTRAYFAFTTDKGVNVQNYLSSYTYYVNGTASSLAKSLTLDSSNSSTNMYYGYIGSTSGGSFDANYTYNISVEVTMTDVNGESHTLTVGSFISAEVYEIDISANGNRVSFGKFATDGKTSFGVEIAGTLEADGSISAGSGSVSGEMSVGSLKINNNSVGDHIVAYGSDSKWIYEKYSSGKLKAWYTSGSTTVTLTTSSGNGWYRNSSAYSIPIPSSMGCASITYANIVARNDLANMITSITGVSTSSLSYYVSHLGSISSYSSVIMAEIVGTWS